MRLYFQYALNKGQTTTIECFILSLSKQSPISQLNENAKLWPNQIYFIFVIRNIKLQYKDRKWNSWVCSNQLLNCNFRQHLRHYKYWNATQRWINFWIVTLPTSRLGTTFLGLEHLYEKTKHVVSPSGLNFEFSMRKN